LCIHASKCGFPSQVGNVPSWTQADWVNDMTLASGRGVDAFALNIANNFSGNAAQIGLAFAAAEKSLPTLGFKLFFSFDYAGGGPWAAGDVSALISKYSSSSAYYRYSGKPFVSTFEGPDNAAEWVSIKASTGCFFVPDWSSSGANVAIGLAGGVADGLFSK
jgi:Glycosyl hydrolase family 71